MTAWGMHGFFRFPHAANEKAAEPLTRPHTHFNGIKCHKRNQSVSLTVWLLRQRNPRRGENLGVFAMLKSLSAGLILSTLAVGAIGAIAATSDPAMMAKTTKGNIMVDAKGMTLYSFDKDVVGKSNCNDKCAAEWPPLMAAADAKASGDWTIVARDDKSKMWAYKGHPLYTFVDDKAVGQVTGDKKDGFHIVM
jgi:predicted lipoprotein with Yx(FWY)xxD motif